MRRIWMTTCALFAGVLVCGATLGQDLERGSGQSTALQTAAVSHITFGSNLLVDPCTGCSYSEDGGYFVVGPDNCTAPETEQWLGVSFIAEATGVPERISAPIILFDPKDCPADKVTLSLYSDKCGAGPGERLVSAVVTAVEAPCDFAVAKLKDAPSLTKGKKYWVVATTSANQASLDANWYSSNKGQVAINMGDGWGQPSGGTPAFRIEGSKGALGEAALAEAGGGFGGNLFIDPCTGCPYDSRAAGFDLHGPDNCTSPGSTMWLSTAFVALKTGSPARILASILLKSSSSCPENQVTLSLCTDDCGLGPAKLPGFRWPERGFR